jgi:hypothetical protein
LTLSLFPGFTTLRAPFNRGPYSTVSSLFDPQVWVKDLKPMETYMPTGDPRGFPETR